MHEDSYRLTGYQLIFSHPEMITDLLKGFIAGDWVGQCDFASLQKKECFPNNAGDMKNTVVWRICYGNTELRSVCLLLLFESHMDPFLAIKIQRYVTLLYQQMLRTEQYQAANEMPPVLPVVIYHGKQRWKMKPSEDSTTVSELSHYQIENRYLLIDAAGFEETEKRSENLVAALFRLEKCLTKQEMLPVVSYLLDRLSEPETFELNRAFTARINEILAARNVYQQIFSEDLDLDEMRDKLAIYLETGKLELN